MIVKKIKGPVSSLSRIEDAKTVQHAIVALYEVKDALKFLYSENEDGTVNHNRIDELKSLTNSYDAGFIAALKNLQTSKFEIEVVSNNMQVVKNVQGLTEHIQWINNNKDQIFDIKAKIAKIEESVVESKLYACRSDIFSRKSKEYTDRLINFYSSTMKPNIDKNNILIEELKTELAKKVHELQVGHENAKSFYDSKIAIRVCPMSYEEGPYQLKEDPVYDAQGNLTKKGLITYVVPEPVCHKIIDASTLNINTSPTAAQIAAGVNAYLLANPDFGGGAGSGLVPVTQDAVNQALAEGAL